MAWLITILILTGCQLTEAAPTAVVQAVPPTTEATLPVATSTSTPNAAFTPDSTPTTAAETSTPTSSSETESVTSTPPSIGEVDNSRELDQPEMQEYPVPPGSRPHDVAPAPDGTVWYTAQGSGELGRLDPNTGETHHIPLGGGSAPHGVIVGPDGAAWVTDGGLNAIVRVDPETEQVWGYALPATAGYANLNTATFDADGILWFTGQSGIYGYLDPSEEQVYTFPAPRGRGPYGITTTPDGKVFYASLAGSHIAQIDLTENTATVIEPPTPNQGARRVWADSLGQIWVSEWDGGQLGRYDPVDGSWQEWQLPGERPMPYAVYVDEQDMIWLSDFGANALVRFDPTTETFEVFTIPSSTANVRQILGRPGEIWGAESGTDKLVVIRTRRAN